MSGLPPIAITVAPNGSFKTKADHPAVPLTAAELARCAAECRDAGAAMIHLHVRDADGRHLLDADAYRDATKAVRAAVGEAMVIQITSEAAGRYQAPEQMAVVTAVWPEAVSVALREIVRAEDDVSAASRFFDELAHERVATQLILYSAEDLASYRALRARGALSDAPLSLLFVLGRYVEGQRSSPADLLPFLSSPVEEPWSVCAFGPRECECVTAAALLGGHVRVGFENNLLLPNGAQAPDNAALVGGVARALEAVGRRLASADELRSLSGMI